ncbi:MAG: ATP-binding protein [Treponema sp.]|nr:ATP-binding protein [Treponema sp.]
MAHLDRTMSQVIEKASKGFRVVLLTGQRQVGKSTMLGDISKGTGRKYVSLDDLANRALAQNDPELFLLQNPPPVIIDEIQYAPNLFTYIKIYADENPTKKSAFWLTGSQKYRLMQGVQESLAGRIGIFDMMGLSYREKIKKPFSGKPFMPSMDKLADGKKLTPLAVYEQIWAGGMPELFVNKNIDRDQFYSSYIQSYIERDVKDFYSIEKPIQFFQLLSVVAAQTGQLLNYTSVARDVGIDIKTAQTWMGILERSGLVYLLRPYSPNVTSRIIKTPKIYFLDTGLAAYLTKWPNAETLMNGAMAGAILETYAVGEILKSYFHNGKEPYIWLYRDKNQNEVDLVIEEAGTLYPIEIKKTANPGLGDYSGFKELAKLQKKAGLGAVLCMKQERIALSREVVSIPIWEI